MYAGSFSRRRSGNGKFAPQSGSPELLVLLDDFELDHSEMRGVFSRHFFKAVGQNVEPGTVFLVESEVGNVLDEGIVLMVPNGKLSIVWPAVRRMVESEQVVQVDDRHTAEQQALRGAYWKEESHGRIAALVCE